MSKKSKNKQKAQATPAVNTVQVTAVKPEWEPNTASMQSGKVQMTGPDNNTPAMPTVYYTPEVAEQMDYIVEKCTDEVGWLGLVTHYEELDAFLIHRIMVPEQQVHSTTTEISDEGLEKVALELIEEGEDTSTMFAWYHSHVNMPVNPSSQDELQVAEYLTNCPIFIRGIVNKKGDSKVDVYYRDHGIAYTCVPTAIHYAFETDPLAGLDEILKERVKKKVYAPAYNNYNYYQNTRVQPRKADDPYVSMYNGQRPYTSVPINSHMTAHTPAVNTGDTTFDNNMQGQLYDPETNAYEDITEETTWGNAAFDTDEEMSLLYAEHQNYTGYGFDWDEQDPVQYRPNGWMIDEMYIEHGHEHDTIGNFHYKQHDADAQELDDFDIQF
jgi:hypothetical protein